MNIDTVTPKLVVPDADAAIDFYAAALGAEVTERYELDGTIVFAEIRFGDLRLQLKDADDVDPAPAEGRRTGHILDVVVADPDALAAAFVAAGAEVVFPIADQPYGVRQGRVRDPFGQEWILGTPNRLSPDEIQAALDGA